MSPLADQMIRYANYHRDPRNIATHMVGIPMIVLSISVLLAQPVWSLLGAWGSPAWLLALAATLFYYWPMGWRVGLIMGLVLSVSNLVGAALAQTPNGWLIWGVGLLVVGWGFQFVGHFWEGRKPAFVDDLRGLLQGPLFVACELAFLLGLLSGLKTQIEAASGPVRRNPHHRTHKT